MRVASSQIVCLWLSVKVISGSTALFESRIIDCSQEETFGNLLSRLSSQRVGKCGFFFLPATQVYFVIKLAQATKHQVGLALYLSSLTKVVQKIYLSIVS